MNLTVILGDTSVDIQVDNDSPDNLIDIFMNEGIYIAANCGRMGICGKCDVFVRELDSKKLACKIDKEWLMGYDRLTLEVANYMLDSNMKIEEGLTASKSDKTGMSTDSSRQLSLAIDVGTTTVVLALVDSNSGEVIDTCSRVNSQRLFGSDVISRINAASNGKLDTLHKCIVDDIISGTKEICTNNGTAISGINSVVITGNTTMCHILMRYECDGLGVYPYTPITVDTIRTDTHRLLGIKEIIPVLIPPGFTTYVGADIASGLLAIRSGIDDVHTFILIDLGTNAEMVLCSGDNYYVTSTAAGPAFEGVNISCGVPSIEGAINRFELRDGKAIFDTIGAKSPIGICGSGLIDIIYELRANNIIDENGTLIDRFHANGYKIYKDIILLQEDIRQFQLAKGAIRTGIEILLEESGMIYSDVDKIYISGGFGSSINVAKAASIGIIPSLLKDKAEAIGNSSIGGAVILASSAYKGDNEDIYNNDVGIDYLEAIAASAIEINLSEHNKFQNKYMESMCIERED